jgi:hypothetical protein
VPAGSCVAPSARPPAAETGRNWTFLMSIALTFCDSVATLKRHRLSIGPPSNGIPLCLRWSISCDPYRKALTIHAPRARRAGETALASGWVREPCYLGRPEISRSLSADLRQVNFGPHSAFLRATSRKDIRGLRAVAGPGRGGSAGGRRGAGGIGHRGRPMRVRRERGGAARDDRAPARAAGGERPRSRGARPAFSGAGGGDTPQPERLSARKSASRRECR